MKLAVMGTGAIGGYIGARLAASGVDVTFIARGAHLAAIRTAGLRISSRLGDVHVTFLPAGPRPRAPSACLDDPTNLVMAGPPTEPPR